MASQRRFPDRLACIRAQIRHLNHTHALPIPPPVVVKTQRVLTKQAEKIAQHADKHEQFLNKVTYCLGVLSFGLFCFLLGSNPQDIPRLYCLFFICIAPLRWIYYRIKKWHYYLLDFCYYANAIFVTMLLFFPNNDKFFMLCFSFSEGPLAWALIVWRCSLVFSSIDKIISVLIHSLPGTVFFILRWWDPSTFPRHDTEEVGPWPAWPGVNSASTLWMWLFWVPLLAYCVWQALYFLVVEGLRRQRILKDPELKTSYRELARKAERANNIWWHLSGLLGAEKRVIMYAIIQAAFTVATMALTVPMFKSYRLHIGFEVFKLSATVWNGGNFIFNVMPRQAVKQMKQHVTADGRAVKAVMDPSAVTTPETDANSENMASLAKFVVEKINVPKQGDCDLCRKASSENLRDYGNSGMNRADEDLSTNESGGSLLQTMSRLMKVPDGMHLHKRQTAFTGNLDSQIRGRTWNGQITCAS